MGSFLMTVFAYVWLGYVLFMYEPNNSAVHIIFDGLLVTSMIAFVIFLFWLML